MHIYSFMFMHLNILVLKRVFNFVIAVIFSID